MNPTGTPVTPREAQLEQALAEATKKASTLAVELTHEVGFRELAERERAEARQLFVDLSAAVREYFLRPCQNTLTRLQKLTNQ